MRDSHYDSSADSVDALKNKYKISRKPVNERFNPIEEEADSLVSDYGLEEEGEQGVIREYLKIAFAEDIVLSMGTLEGGGRCAAAS